MRQIVSRSRGTAGFTLLETAVALAVLLVMFAVAVPHVRAFVREHGDDLAVVLGDFNTGPEVKKGEVARAVLIARRDGARPRSSPAGLSR